MIDAQLQQAVQVQRELTSARFSEWLHDDVLKLNWWIMLALFALTSYLWWKTVKKKRLAEIMLYTTFIIIFILVLDELGEELGLWYYTTDIFPLFPPITAINISCMPFLYMLVYQYCKTWKSFTIATFVMSAVFCFVFEPIFVWSGVYKMLIWKSYYGYPIYIAIALISKYVVTLIYPLPSEQNKLSGA